MDLFNTVSWNFTDTEYESAKDFNANFLKHQIKNGKEASSWNPDEIVIENEAVDIVFMAWIKKMLWQRTKPFWRRKIFLMMKAKANLAYFKLTFRLVCLPITEKISRPPN